MSIHSDPYAELFYLSRGAVRIREVPSVAIPGRTIPLEAFLKPLLLFGFDVGVLTEHLQVSTKNPERKVSDEYAVSISD